MVRKPLSALKATVAALASVAVGAVGISAAPAASAATTAYEVTIGDTNTESSAPASNGRFYATNTFNYADSFGGYYVRNDWVSSEYATSPAAVAVTGLFNWYGEGSNEYGVGFCIQGAVPSAFNNSLYPSSPASSNIVRRETIQRYVSILNEVTNSDHTALDLNRVNSKYGINLNNTQLVFATQIAIWAANDRRFTVEQLSDGYYDRIVIPAYVTSYSSDPAYWNFRKDPATGLPAKFALRTERRGWTNQNNLDAYKLIKALQNLDPVEDSSDDFHPVTVDIRNVEANTDDAGNATITYEFDKDYSDVNYEVRAWNHGNEIPVNADIRKAGSTVYVTAKIAARFLDSEGLDDVTLRTYVDGSGKGYSIMDTRTARQNIIGLKKVEYNAKAYQDLYFTRVVNPNKQAGRGEIHTSVEANGQKGTDNVPAITTDGFTNVTDTIDYSGLAEGVAYTFSGQLVDLTEGGRVVATAETTEVVSSSNGSVKVNFGSVELKYGHRYVVYERAESREVIDFTDEGGNKVTGVQVIEHRNPNDVAQTLLIPADGTLRTTVNAGGSTGSDAAPAEVQEGVTTVTDTVTYTGLVPGVSYTVYGELVNAENPSQVFATGSTTFTPDSKNGTVEINFGAVQLTAGVKYVVFETARSNTPVVFTANGSVVEDVQVIEHKNTEDLAQTIVVTAQPKGEQSLGTTVQAGDSRGESYAPAEVAPGTAVVVDTIDYKGLEANNWYEFVGRLVDLTDGNNVVAEASTKEYISSEDGSVEVNFGLQNLEAGHKYVVFETAYKLGISGERIEDSKIVHENPDDQAQTIVVVGHIGTTVRAGGSTGSDSAPAQVSAQDGPVQVVDTIDYTGLAANNTYAFHGQLIDLTLGGVVVAEATEVAYIVNSDGSVEVDFGTQELTAGHRYVVYESAVLVKDGEEVASSTLYHKDPNDLKQTIVVGGYIATTVKAGSATGAEHAPATVNASEVANGIEVVDTIDYHGLEAGKEYTFYGTLVDITDGNREVATASTTTTVISTNGSVKVNFGKVEGLLGGHKYVVFERARQTDGNGNQVPGTTEYVHENPNDQAQTVVVNRDMKTTVTGNGKTSNANNSAEVTPTADGSVKVVDHIDYYGFTPGMTYTFTGALIDITSGSNRTVAVASTTVTVDSPNGTADVDFGTVTGLEVGHKYVVFERAISADGSQVIRHEDVNDAAQTIIVGQPIPEQEVPTTSVEPKPPADRVTTKPAPPVQTTTEPETPPAGSSNIPWWVLLIPLLLLVPAIALGAQHLMPAPPAPAKPTTAEPGTGKSFKRQQQGIKISDDAAAHGPLAAAFDALRQLSAIFNN